MLHIRKSMNIVDSYQSEIDTPGAANMEANINLDFEGFEEENAQLTDRYQLTPGSSTVAMVRHYTAGSEINGELIQAGGDIEQLSPRMRVEYNALVGLKRMGVTLGELHHTYSGTGSFDPREVTEDDVFTTPAFMSTSLSIKVAVKTANYRRNEADEAHQGTVQAMLGTEDHVLHFVLPEGFGDGWYVAPYSHDPEELEFLIFPNTRFKYLGTKVIKAYGVIRHFHSYEPAGEARLF